MKLVCSFNSLLFWKTSLVVVSNSLSFLSLSFFVWLWSFSASLNIDSFSFLNVSFSLTCGSSSAF
ncbi:hypothetical protein OM999_04760 [Mycoplasmopsis cynos]|uniref:hypothetical protein n=1 Tax=Mycoplasmopsis cynos TaxID=171284 RepID=UPI0024C7B141|nr:hypothetical protein OM999_04760 [Mycoplasmopsis cynos]